MTNAQLKALVAERLAKDGIWLNTALPLREIAKKVEEHTGQRKRYSEGQFDFLYRYAGVARQSGRYVPEFRPMDPAKHRHPRAAEIDRDQPRLITPNGIGNDRVSSGYPARVWG